MDIFDMFLHVCFSARFVITFLTCNVPYFQMNHFCMPCQIILVTCCEVAQFANDIFDFLVYSIFMDLHVPRSSTFVVTFLTKEVFDRPDIMTVFICLVKLFLRAVEKLHRLQVLSLIFLCTAFSCLCNSAIEAQWLMLHFSQAKSLTPSWSVVLSGILRFWLLFGFFKVTSIGNKIYGFYWLI